MPLFTDRLLRFQTIKAMYQMQPCSRNGVFELMNVLDEIDLKTTPQNYGFLKRIISADTVVSDHVSMAI